MWITPMFSRKPCKGNSNVCIFCIFLLTTLVNFSLTSSTEIFQNTVYWGDFVYMNLFRILLLQHQIPNYCNACGRVMKRIRICWSKIYFKEENLILLFFFLFCLLVNLKKISVMFRMPYSVIITSYVSNITQHSLHLSY